MLVMHFADCWVLWVFALSPFKKLQWVRHNTTHQWVQAWAKFLRIYGAETFLWHCIMHKLFTAHWQRSIIKALKWHTLKNLNTPFCWTCAMHCSSRYPTSLMFVGDVSYSNLKTMLTTSLSHTTTNKRYERRDKSQRTIRNLINFSKALC